MKILLKAGADPNLRTNVKFSLTNFQNISKCHVFWKKLLFLKVVYFVFTIIHNFELEKKPQNILFWFQVELFVSSAFHILFYFRRTVLLLCCWTILVAVLLRSELWSMEATTLIVTGWLIPAAFWRKLMTITTHTDFSLRPETQSHRWQHCVAIKYARTSTESTAVVRYVDISADCLCHLSCWIISCSQRS